MASVDEAGIPLTVPICFVYKGEFIYSPIDAKPKTKEVKKLKRLRNIENNPRVSFIVDKYSDDWTELYYIIVQGTAEVLIEGEEYNNSIKALCGKYEQYSKMGLMQLGLPVIKITPNKIISWGN